MIEPTVVTWILIIAGFITCGPLFYVQLMMLRDPRSKKVRDIAIGKDQDWRDKTHFHASLGGAWADWIVAAPLLIFGTIGVLLGTVWGYLLYAAAGAVMVYISIILWFQEKKYVFPAHGALAYYTYYWGNFVYRGAASVIYALLRLNGVTI
jgi:hypothetical protein